MHTPCPFPYKKSVATLSLAIAALAGSCAAMADTVDLGTIGGSGGAATTTSVKAERGTAASVAPTQSNLKATEPQSIISRSYIEESVAPTGNFNSIIGIAPSVATQPAPNGPGLGDVKSTMRGFQDGDYNVTFDGIPFGDTNNPTHHSTSYFPAAVIGGVVIDRGPGNASNLGQATYGGSVNLLSKVPSAEQKSSVYGSIGTWGTQLEGISFESGRMQNYGDATLQLDYQHLGSPGYLTNYNIKSDTFTGKYQRPVGDASLLTLFSAYTDVFTNVPDSTSGATLAQVAKFGKNYGLNNDPTSQGFVGYNHVSKQTDFEYARVQTSWGSGWETDNNLYTYAYKNSTFAGQDASGYLGSGILATGATANGVKLNGVTYKTDVPGYDKLNQYRVIGDIFKATNKMDAGLLRAGVWIETADTPRHNLAYDLTQSAYTGVFGSKNFDQHSTWKQYQPFAEFEWVAAPGLTVTPGLKYMSFTRSVSAPVANQGNVGASNFSENYKATLPFLTVNKLLSSDMSVYTQYAQGMQVPALSYLQVATPSFPANNPEPQKTTNYQIGVVKKSDAFTWDADLYYIDINNLIGQSTVAGQTQFYNAGGAVYKGAEGQMTYVIGSGFSAYANAGINSASYKSGNAFGYSGAVASAPNMTAALGALYNSGPWVGSLIYKRTGMQYAYPNQPATYQIAAYGNADLNIAYTFKNLGSIGGKALKLQLSIFNLTNSQNVISVSKGSVVALDQYQWQAPRSYMLSAKVDF